MCRNLPIKRMNFPTTPIFYWRPASRLKVLNILTVLQRPLAISSEIRRKSEAHCLCQYTPDHLALSAVACHTPVPRPQRKRVAAPQPYFCIPPHPLLRGYSEHIQTKTMTIPKHLPTLHNKVHYRSYSFDIKRTVFYCTLIPVTW